MAFRYFQVLFLLTLVCLSIFEENSCYLQHKRALTKIIIYTLTPNRKGVGLASSELSAPTGSLMVHQINFYKVEVALH